MSRTERIEAVTTAARALDSAIRGLRDEELLAEAAALEEAGRILDARRLAGAAKVQWRSRPQLRDNGLEARQGERNGVDLLVKECRISTREARRRIAIGSPLAPRLSLTGEEVVGRFPVLAAAVTAGTVPLDSARIIVDTLGPLRRRVSVEEASAAEEALTEEAARTSPDLVLIQAVQWAMRLDQEGAQPSEEQSPLHGRHVASRRVGTGSVGPQGGAGVPVGRHGRPWPHRVLRQVPGRGEGRDRRGPDRQAEGHPLHLRWRG